MSTTEKKHINNINRYRVTYPFDKFIDEDVQSMILPLNLVQTLLFCPKYRINNNFIYPNTLASNLVSLLGGVISILLLFNRIYELYSFEVLRKYYNIAYIAVQIEFVLYCIGFFVNYAINVHQSKRNVLFILKFQDVHRCLNEEFSFKRFVFWNWISVFAIIVLYVYVSAHICYLFQLSIYDFFYWLIVLCFDINIICAVRFLRLLAHKVDLWIIQVQRLQQLDHIDKKSYKVMFQAYVNILECYKIYRTCFESMIAYHTSSFFFHTLTKVQMTLDIFKLAGHTSLRTQVAIWFAILILYIWLIKSFLLQIILSLRCEKFYIAINDAQTVCTLILKSNCTDAEKKFCKKIHRLHRATFEKMNVCGMFYIDATFPLKMMALVTNYTIVLMQFALL